MSSSPRENSASQSSDHADPDGTWGALGPHADFIIVGNAPFAVVDWRADVHPGPGESVDIKPHLTTFADADELSKYINQPCRLPTAVRLIHTVNAPEPPEPFNESGDLHDDNVFGLWASRGKRQKAANLGCFAWEPIITGFRDPKSKGPRPTSEIRISEACCSLDYFGLCKHSSNEGSPCLHDKHSLTFVTPDSGESEGDSTCTYTACPRTISIVVRHGPLAHIQPDELNPDDPAFVLVVCEDVPHTCPPFFDSRLSFSIHGRPNEEGAAASILDVIFRRLFGRISYNWTDVVNTAVRHSRYLEDRVYIKPDDESQSPALWAASKSWMTIDRLLRAHIAVLGEFESSFDVVQSEPVVHGVLKDTAAKLPAGVDEPRRPRYLLVNDVVKTMERCLVKVQDDLIKPTTNLLDMLYKSVAIRDARLSLELNASLWRLSWITFIFLPLTFLSGFFGMNVDLFSDNPSIKWYFISAAGLVALFFLMWLGIKLAQKRNLSFGRQSKSYRNMV
ncbi:hypothetical protein QBC37DRAFT_113939 [Rhypophila decipiens]|uniref:Uncharacterized protein n=1 Tax=Rhypophila decipiens TaxID=261697 RepID=A0AAN6XTZ2_9PEZI|nr:hypothetical protein QBC37DRAFT_113939 [Rhypophila decipiens]